MGWDVNVVFDVSTFRIVGFLHVYTWRYVQYIFLFARASRFVIRILWDVRIYVYFTFIILVALTLSANVVSCVGDIIVLLLLHDEVSHKIMIHA